MKNEKLGQEPAFPTMIEERTSEYANIPDTLQYQTGGISKRFYAACAAIKSKYCKEDDLCDDDMIEDERGHYVKNVFGQYYIPIDPFLCSEDKKYSVKPEITEITRYVRFAYKMVDEVLTQENQ